MQSVHTESSESYLGNSYIHIHTDWAIKPLPSFSISSSESETKVNYINEEKIDDWFWPRVISVLIIGNLLLRVGTLYKYSVVAYRTPGGRWLVAGVGERTMGLVVMTPTVLTLWLGQPPNQSCHRTPGDLFATLGQQVRPQPIEYKLKTFILRYTPCNPRQGGVVRGWGSGRTYPCVCVNILHSGCRDWIHWFSIVCQSRHFHIVNENCTTEPYDLLSLKPRVSLSSKSI